MECMEFQVDIWLRGDNHATTQVIAAVPREPRAWTDADIVAVLERMLRALKRAKDPDASPDRPMALDGFSWIVNSFETGGVVIALEGGRQLLIARRGGLQHELDNALIHRCQSDDVVNADVFIDLVNGLVNRSPFNDVGAGRCDKAAVRRAATRREFR